MERSQSDFTVCTLTIKQCGLSISWHKLSYILRYVNPEFPLKILACLWFLTITKYFPSEGKFLFFHTLTVWKLEDFSAIKIFREINKADIYSHGQ